jgi:D-alanyl-D-alanine carboxypeptidase/D-alanyl-D-alanine-endopeptidase (penicillin-binding protein 4)
VSGGDDNVVSLVRSPGKNEVALRGQLRSANSEPFSVTVNDPPMFTGTVLTETIARQGVKVTGEVMRDRSVHERHAKDPNGWTVIAALDTKIATVLDRANKDSMNLYAECLCKRLGREISGDSGSWANGTAAVGAFLAKIGVPPTQFHLDDGCGLSRENNVTADAIVKVLAYDFRGPNREVFLHSLAVPGEEGTFKKRFRGPLHDRVFGKSGYVNNVSALSGYLKARDEKWYAFSILMNNLPGGTNNTAKDMQERVVAAIDENADKVAR